MRGKLILIIIIFFTFLISGCIQSETPSGRIEGNEIILPKPSLSSETSLEQAILNRRSIRDYSESPLSLKEISQILWAAQGITSEDGKRTSPSAGAIYPLELYIVAGNVKGLEKGVYHYNPSKHSITKVLNGDLRAELARASLGQSWVSKAPIDLVFSGVYERTTGRYGERGIRYVHMEVGHAAENVYLQCESLGLGTVVVGAFSDEDVRKLLALPENENPLYVMPIGRKK
jgi:SagB-type dehydrogenase family enzyme